MSNLDPKIIRKTIDTVNSLPIWNSLQVCLSCQSTLH